MSELTIDISETTHETLLSLARTWGEDLPTIMERAVENYRRYIFLTQANRAFTALRDNEELSCSTSKLLAEKRQKAEGRRQKVKPTMQFKCRTAYGKMRLLRDKHGISK